MKKNVDKQLIGANLSVYEKCLKSIPFIAVFLSVGLGAFMCYLYNSNTSKLIETTATVNEKEFLLESLDLDVKDSSLIVNEAINFGVDTKISIPAQNLNLKLKETSISNSLTGSETNFLEAHYVITTNLLNSWLTIIGMILTFLTIIIPFLGYKWFKKQDEEIQKKLEEMQEAKESAKKSAKQAQLDKKAIEDRQAEKRKQYEQELARVNVTNAIKENIRHRKFDIVKYLLKENRDLLDPNSQFEIRKEMVIDSLKLHDYDFALNTAKKILEYNIDNVYSYILMGRSLMEKALYEQSQLSEESYTEMLNSALKNFQEAEKINPNNYLTYFYLGQNYIYLKCPKMSINCYLKLVELNSSSILAYSNLSALYLAAAKIDDKEEFEYCIAQAEEAAKSAIDLDALGIRIENIELQGIYFANYASILLYKGNYSLAKYFAEKAYSSNIKAVFPVDTLLLSYVFNGRLEESVNIVKSSPNIEYLFEDKFVERMRQLKSLRVGTLAYLNTDILKNVLERVIGKLSLDSDENSKFMLRYFEVTLELFNVKSN